MGKKFGVSFSLKRLVGITSLKQSISKSTGVPLTKIGMNAKVGRSLIRLFLGK